MAKKRRVRGGGYRGGGGGGSRSLWIGAGAGALAAIVLVAVMLVVMGGGGDDGPEQSSGMEPPVTIMGPNASVEIVDNRFKPANIIISPGTTVTWKNNGSLPHDVTQQRDGDQEVSFASETLSKGDTFTHEFSTVGSYYYYCTIHHSMLGSVEVR